MFQQEGYDLMAAAFEVYNEIGYGMAEEIYQQSEDQRRFVFRCLWKEELVFQRPFTPALVALRGSRRHAGG